MFAIMYQAHIYLNSEQLAWLYSGPFFCRGRIQELTKLFPPPTSQERDEIRCQLSTLHAMSLIPTVHHILEWVHNSSDTRQVGTFDGDMIVSSNPLSSLPPPEARLANGWWPRQMVSGHSITHSQYSLTRVSLVTTTRLGQIISANAKQVPHNTLGRSSLNKESYDASPLELSDSHHYWDWFSWSLTSTSQFRNKSRQSVTPLQENCHFIFTFRIFCRHKTPGKHSLPPLKISPCQAHTHQSTWYRCVLGLSSLHHFLFHFLRNLFKEEV